MYDTREKLIDLLYQCEKEADIKGYYNCAINPQKIEFVADYLIANGVTLQKWIPVSERLPEVFAPVLVKYLNYNDGGASPTNVDTAVLLEGNVWYWWEGDLADCDDEVKCTITHWMPLPEPPGDELA